MSNGTCYKKKATFYKELKILWNENYTSTQEKTREYAYLLRKMHEQCMSCLIVFIVHPPGHCFRKNKLRI